MATHSEIGQTTAAAGRTFTLRMPPIDRQAVGRRIKLARERAGLTNQQALADALKVSRNTISAWEVGHWNLDALEQVAHATRTEWEWLLHGDDRLIDGNVVREIMDRLDKIERRLREINDH